MSRPTPVRNLPADYPRELEQHVALADGSTIFVRPVIPDDAGVLADAARTSDPETLYFRFFTTAPRLDEPRINYLTTLDYRRRLALAAFAEDGTGLAIVRYEGREGAEEAEVAFAVKEGYRRLGIASRLYGMLEEAASARGIHRFTAIYLVENDGAAELLDRLGFSEPVVTDGVAEVSKELPGGALAA